MSTAGERSEPRPEGGVAVRFAEADTLPLHSLAPCKEAER